MIKTHFYTLKFLHWDPYREYVQPGFFFQMRNYTQSDIVMFV